MFQSDAADLVIANGNRKAQLCFAAREVLDSLDSQLAIGAGRAAISELLQLGQGINEDKLMEVFASISLQRELATERTDEFGRFDESAITWDVSRPWVDLWASEIGRRGVESGFTARPSNARFSVLITHDVDRTTPLEPFSILNSVVNTLRPRHGGWWPFSTAISPRALIGTIERLLEFERSHQVGAHYFMMAGPYGFGRYSPRTDVRWTSARTILRLLLEARMNIGLHGSFSARDHNSYREEKDRLEQAIGSAVLTHRNHYLRFDPTRLYSQLGKAGIRFDLSVGFVSRTGFRAGCARCYRAFDLLNCRASKVFSVPQLFMDTVLRYCSPEAALAELHQALSHVKAVCGCVCLVFHPEAFLIDSRSWSFFQNVVLMCRNIGADLSGELPEVGSKLDARA